MKADMTRLASGFHPNGPTFTVLQIANPTR